jgi:hypothetical protein
MIAAPRKSNRHGHSPAYFTAAGVADREFGWIHASAAKIADPIIHRLIDKVSVGPQPTESIACYRQGAKVTKPMETLAFSIENNIQQWCLNLGKAVRR